MNIVDRALEILKKVDSSLTLKSFLQKLQPIVEQYKELSAQDIKVKVLEYIKNDQPFGEAIAQGANSALGEDNISEEEKKAIMNQIAQGEYGEVEQCYTEVFNKVQEVQEFTSPEGGGNINPPIPQ